MIQFVSIVIGTLISEDLACIAAGLAIRQGELSWAIGLGACYFGILLGDFGLWLVGRLIGPGLLEQAWVQRVLPQRGVERLSEWFDRRGWAPVFMARFMPGARFPIYLAAGILGRDARQFLLYAALAGLLWTPTLVVAVYWVGKPLVDWLHAFFETAWIAIPVAVLILWLVLKLVFSLLTSIGRAKWIARISTIWRWEFWPAWLFYLPLVPWIAWLVVRYGWRSMTAANPGIPHSGVVGESKSQILRQLPGAWVVPSALLPSGETDERLAALDAFVSGEGLAYPLILKPDAGERGAGVRRIADRADAEIYLRDVTVPVLAQAFDPGPFEAGVFYYRFPDAERGVLYSITDKIFPVITGDGVHTLTELIWRHPRYRMQAGVFLSRHAERAERVLDAGETLQLAQAGNHCQGTLFRDGSDLLTDALCDRIDEIARSFPGFFFGRFDLRYSDRDAFRRGEDLRIVELNGALSESTNLYDPSFSLWHAHRILRRQWQILFEIGAANRRAGIPGTSLSALLAAMRAYYREQKVHLQSS